jgi:lipopolysaccharide transport system ATP-binding protein
MSEIAIRCEGLGKRYRLGEQERYRALRDTLSNAIRSPWRLLKPATNGASLNGSHLWALRDVSFEIRRGEAVGVIGRNGAGKSTLLKILSRITKPTEGMAEIHGRVGSLLEVGTGFHPELTGRENIYLNGSILGMRRAEIERKFDEIVAFAEVEEFIDTPVKRYSSGMHVRLAFAVAAHLEPEILLVDEVLAVGDVAFQKKCLGKMDDVAREGRTVFFVSHDMTAIQVLCKQAIVLKQGRVFSQGPAQEQIEGYLNTERKQSDIGPESFVALGSDLQLKDFRFSPNPVSNGSPVEFTLGLTATRRANIRDLAMLIYNSLGRRVAVLDLRELGEPYELDHRNQLNISGRIENLPLVEGDYYVGLYVNSGDVTKDFYDLLHLSIANGTEHPVVPYHVASRGVVALDYTIEAASLNLEA